MIKQKNQLIVMAMQFFAFWQNQPNRGSDRLTEKKHFCEDGRIYLKTIFDVYNMNIFVLFALNIRVQVNWYNEAISELLRIELNKG